MSDRATYVLAAAIVLAAALVVIGFSGRSFVDTPAPASAPNAPVQAPALVPPAQASAPRSRFVDNGDGTITDNATRLVWEKKSDNGDIHDKDNTYTWSTGTNNPDGTSFTVFLAALNNVNFAGHTDWRLPTIEELRSLMNGSYADAAPTTNALFTHSIFRDGAVVGCSATSVSCSWTRPDFYWSSTTHQIFPNDAWYVHFYGGIVLFGTKTHRYAVRAVRAGS